MKKLGSILLDGWKMSYPRVILDSVGSWRYAMAAAVHYQVRHATAPAPNGCRWCGVEQRSHGQRWTRGAGLHTWTTPTSQQRLARMRSRRASRIGRIGQIDQRSKDVA